MSKHAQYKKKKVNGERGYEAADRELEQKLLDAQTELEECADDLQELNDRSVLMSINCAFRIPRSVTWRVNFRRKPRRTGWMRRILKTFEKG